MAVQAEPSNEFTATPIRLEDYVRRPEWAALPLPIKVAVVHLWRAEHDPPNLDEPIAPEGH